MGLFLILWPIVDFPHLFLYGYDLFSSFRTKDKFIHSQESLLESSLIVPFFVILISLEFLNEMSFDKLWYFGSCYIKNKEYLHDHRKLRKASFSYRWVAIGQCEHLPCKFSSLNQGSNLPHMWVDTYSRPRPRFVSVCFWRSGCDRKEPMVINFRLMFMKSI